MNKDYNQGNDHYRPYRWQGKLNEEMKEGAIIKGRIIAVMDFGAVLEIAPGIEGLIRVPEVTWSLRAINTHECFKLNEEHHAKIYFLNEDEKRIYLSIKRLTEDPWNKIKEKYPQKSCHTGIVTNIMPYGVFVKLEYGIGGVILLTDSSGAKINAHPTESLKKGQSVEVSILNIDIMNRKLTLGYK